MMEYKLKLVSFRRLTCRRQSSKRNSGQRRTPSTSCLNGNRTSSRCHSTYSKHSLDVALKDKINNGCKFVRYFFLSPVYLPNAVPSFQASLHTGASCMLRKEQAPETLGRHGCIIRCFLAISMQIKTTRLGLNLMFVI